MPRLANLVRVLKSDVVGPGRLLSGAHLTSQAIPLVGLRSQGCTQCQCSRGKDCNGIDHPTSRVNNCSSVRATTKGDLPGPDGTPPVAANYLVTNRRQTGWDRWYSLFRRQSTCDGRTPESRTCSSRTLAYSWQHTVAATQSRPAPRDRRRHYVEDREARDSSGVLPERAELMLR